MCPFFFFNDTATTEIYTLSLHDALPICLRNGAEAAGLQGRAPGRVLHAVPRARPRPSPRLGLQGRSNARSEEHTSELQSRQYLVCRLLLEKKKKSPFPSTNTKTSISSHS